MGLPTFACILAQEVICFICIPDVSMIFGCMLASQCGRYLCINTIQMHPTPPTSPTVHPFNIAKQNISILYHITRSTFPLKDAKHVKLGTMT